MFTVTCCVERTYRNKFLTTGRGLPVLGFGSDHGHGSLHLVFITYIANLALMTHQYTGTYKTHTRCIIQYNKTLFFLN